MSRPNRPHRKSILSGVRVLDLSRILAGPYCTQILSDQGAEVIKVESPLGDETRRWGPPFQNHQSAYFSGINRNKKSIVLDLKKKVSIKALHKLLETSDVLIENFKFGDFKKFGFSDQLLKKKYPHLIHCQISGFGLKSEFKNYPGYDAAIQAWSGLMSINGSFGPTKVGVPIVDLVTGLNAAFAIVAALYERGFSSKGQKIETSLLENAFSILHPQTTNYFFSKRKPALLGNTHPNIAPYDLFQTKNSAIYIACGNDRQFQILCEALGSQKLALNPKFSTNELRVRNRTGLNKLMKPLLMRQDAKLLSKKLLRLGVPSGPALSIPEALREKHVKDSKIVRKIGNQNYVMPPFQFSRSSKAGLKPPPHLGANTLEILKNLDLKPNEMKDILKQLERPIK